MIRFLALWVVMFVVLAATTIATSFWLFRHVDLTFEAFAVWWLVPPVQATAIVLAARPPRLATLRLVCREMWGHPFVTPVLFLDVALLCALSVPRFVRMPALAEISSLQSTWVGTKAIAAAGFFLMALGGGHRLGEVGKPGRRILTLFVLVLLALGVAGIWPWLKWVPGAIFSGRSRVPTLFQWAAVYGSIFAAAIALTLAAGMRLRRRSPSLGILCDAAVALSLAGGIVVILNMFIAPVIDEPWRTVALVCASLAASLLLVCAILVAVPQTRTS